MRNGFRAVAGLALSLLGCAALDGAPAAAQQNDSRGIDAEQWIEAQQPPRRMGGADEGISDDLRSLRREFAEWWNQPPGPSASKGFVRERSEDRRREQERLRALQEDYERRLRRRRSVAASGEVDEAPVPRIAPRTIASAAEEGGAPDLAPIPQTRSAAAPELSNLDLSDQELLAAAPPAGPSDGDAIPEDLTSLPASARIMTEPKETPTETPQERPEALEAASAAPPLATDPFSREPVDPIFPDESRARFAPGSTPERTEAPRSPETVPPADPATTRAESVRAESAPLAASAPPLEAIVSDAPISAEDAPLYRGAAELIDPETPGRSVQGESFRRDPGPLPVVAPRSGGLLDDPTVRIGLAFTVGLGLLALAFLREWSAARRRSDV